MGILRKLAEKLDKAADKKIRPIVEQEAPRPALQDGETGGAR